MIAESPEEVMTNLRVDTTLNLKSSGATVSAQPDAIASTKGAISDEASAAAGSEDSGERSALVLFAQLAFAAGQALFIFFSVAIPLIIKALQFGYENIAVPSAQFATDVVLPGAQVRFRVCIVMSYMYS